MIVVPSDLDVMFAGIVVYSAGCLLAGGLLGYLLGGR